MLFYRIYPVELSGEVRSIWIGNRILWVKIPAEQLFSFVALGEVLTVIFHFILQMRIMGSNRMMPLILFQKISKGNRLIKQHGYYH